MEYLQNENDRNMYSTMTVPFELCTKSLDISRSPLAVASEAHFLLRLVEYSGSAKSRIDDTKLDVGKSH